MHYLIVVVYALQGKQLCKCFYLPAFRTRAPEFNLFVRSVTRRNGFHNFVIYVRFQIIARFALFTAGVPAAALSF